MNRRIALVIFGITTLLFIAACGSGTPEPAEITIDMSEFAFAPDTIELEVGQEVTFTLANKGNLPHEIMIGRDVMMMEDHPNGYQIDFFESAGVEPTVDMAEMAMDEHDEGEAGHDEGASDGHSDEEGMAHSGFMVLVPVTGETSSMKFTVTEDMVGEWEIGCFEQEGVHYTAGMRGTLVVKP